MKKLKSVFALVMILTLSLTFLAHAATGREGMVPFKSGEPDGIWAYYYLYEDGTYAKNEWKQVWDDWFYFDENCETKYNAWAVINEKWYYFDNCSRMLHDTTTPDGYKVGPDGAWITE